MSEKHPNRKVAGEAELLIKRDRTGPTNKQKLFNSYIENRRRETQLCVVCVYMYIYTHIYRKSILYLHQVETRATPITSPVKTHIWYQCP